MFSFPFPFLLATLTDVLCRLQNLSPDESLVYNVIHSTGNSGIWVRSIQMRTGLHKSILDRCLKSLESKSYIKSVHNVKFPSRKMYMLAGLSPSEDVTGGAWFTDGVLDENFINSVAGYIEFTVSRQSWYEDVPPVNNSGGGNNKRMKMSGGGIGKGKGKAGKKTATTTTTTSAAPEKKKFLPFPAGYRGYPTVSMITASVNKSGITPVRLGEESILQLLEMLCFDNKLVALGNGHFYKSLKTPEAVKAGQQQQQQTTRKSLPTGTEQQDVVAVDVDVDVDREEVERTKRRTNGMTETPCGQCPVFNLCAPGSAVSPESCEYFDAWFESALGF